MTTSPVRPAINSARLSNRDGNIISLVTRFRQVSAEQILRLYFSDNSPASRNVRMCRALKRLTKWGCIGRIPRAIGGHNGGSTGYIYIPPTSRARLPDPHTLDITETFVRLWESGITIHAFQPEPYCHTNVGHVELKPDAYLKLETPTAYLSYWLEVDRGTEFRPQLHAKMRRYSQAYEKWEGTFPKVVFIVHDKLRLDFIESVIRHQAKPSLFTVVLFEEAVPYMIGE